MKIRKHKRSTCCNGTGAEMKYHSFSEIKIKANNNSPNRQYKFISDFHRISSVDSRQIQEYCDDYSLVEVNLEEVMELLVRNMYIKDNGDRAVLVPMIWLYYGLQ